MNMKAITIWQPWGSAIAIEAKGQQGLWNWEPPEEVLA